MHLIKKNHECYLKHAVRKIVKISFELRGIHITLFLSWRAIVFDRPGLQLVLCLRACSRRERVLS